MADMTYLLGDEIAAHTRLLRASPLGHLDTTEGALLHTVKNDCLIRCAGIVKFTSQDSSLHALALA
ncbi:hypothetical protein E0I00_06140 [Pseudomonas syringae pv. actinidiae]|nr:hypothetical protein [Pseudomonas syringae pv. tomato]NVL58796.1 hypothetical protein [Pseudomonas syringae pv. actinidiae]QBI60595.1 hypothetical protein EIZ61_03295 [Pseudomonas syringae]TES53962.1 hypothetical protein E2N91_23755 [Pseudomonas syringae pv. tomato]TES66247.1 hypothetical protein E2N90_16945 [Pseudomonas syringae pv. tomato]